MILVGNSYLEPIPLLYTILYLAPARLAKILCSLMSQATIILGILFYYY